MVPFATHLLLLEMMFCFGKKIPNLATKKKVMRILTLDFFEKNPLNLPYFKNKKGESDIFRP
jgi:hypothetical protein